MKKQLNIEAITNELQGASLFFHPQAESRLQRDMQPEAPSVRKPRRSDTRTPKPLGVQVPRRPDPQTPRHPAVSAPASREALGFALTDKAEERQTLRLTQPEFRRISQLQGELADVLGVKKVDKNDIIRCGLHRVFDEYGKLGAGSEVVANLRKKYR